MGALELTGFLRDRMQQNNIHFDSPYTVRTLKENLCYVALDYETELSKDREASFAVPLDTWFSLSKERFQTVEILFQPRMTQFTLMNIFNTSQAMGLHQAVALCMDHCHDAELPGDDSWHKTVVLAGRTASLPGLADFFFFVRVVLDRGYPPEGYPKYASPQGYPPQAPPPQATEKRSRSSGFKGKWEETFKNSTGRGIHDCHCK